MNHNFVILKRKEDKPMRTYIKSYNQLLDVFKHSMKDVLFFDGKITEESLFKDYFFFRGQANAEWRLTPRINRNKRIRDVQIDTSDKSRLGVFAEMYGKSARVINFTSDLKLALYYACKDEKYKNCDAKLFVMIINR